ncbi:MAG: phenylacetate--CoA ligase [Clostridia bacterium]|nr:phenylacetate--CoA ligase [Clostridia bacterium]
MEERYWQKEIETAPREQIEAWQSERLIDTVKRVYENVPYYRDMMDKAGVKPEDIKSRDDIVKLPFTCKQDLRDTYPYGLFAVPLKDVVRLHASSGTTGKQIVVGYTKHDLEIWDDCTARQLVATGADENSVVHVSYGYGLFTGGLGLHGGAQHIGATTVPVSSGNTQRQLTIMQDFGSTVLCCTPSYAMFLAETAEKQGIPKENFKLKAGIFGAEPWTEEMRHEIEKRLGLEAFDVYGLTEIIGPGVSYGCHAHDGMHVNEDHFIIEIINPETGEPVKEGEQGEIVFSCITKEAFPILRYRTRDIGYVKYEKCSCGRTFARMSKPMGRTDDMLIIRGVNVFPSQIETVLIKMGYLPNYQIIVDTKDNLDTLAVKVEMGEQHFDDVVKEINRRESELAGELKSLLGVNAKVILCAPNSIERSEGKAKRVVDNRKK